MFRVNMHALIATLSLFADEKSMASLGLGWKQK